MRQGDLRRAYSIEHPLALSLAIWAFMAAVASLGSPYAQHTSSLGIALPGWGVVIYLVLTGVGGLLVLVSFLRLDARLEAVGWCLLAGTLFVDTVAIASVRGVGVLLVSPSVPASAMGGAVRALVLYHRFGEHGPRDV